MSSERVRSAYQLCVYRDGEQCVCCGWTFGMPLTDAQKRHLFGEHRMPRRERIALTEKLMSLELNHIDGNPANNPPEGGNWNIKCKSCNLWGDIEEKVERERERGEKRTSGGELRGRGREDSGDEFEAEVRKVEQASRGVVRRGGDILSEGATLKINQVSFPLFLTHCVAEVIKRGEVEWLDLMRSGAYVAGVSSRKGYTAEEYLNRLTSSAGPLMVIERDGLKLVVLRQPESQREAIHKKAMAGAHNGHSPQDLKRTELMAKGGKT